MIYPPFQYYGGPSARRQAPGPVMNALRELAAALAMGAAAAAGAIGVFVAAVAIGSWLA